MELELPRPKSSGKISVEEAIGARRSIREYRPEPLTLEEISQLLWAAQGITDRSGLRAAPSAGALYPLELYLAAGKVEGLAEGVYKYEPQAHTLKLISQGDKLGELAAAAYGQDLVGKAAALLIFAAVYERTIRKYNEPARDMPTSSSYPRGMRYVHIEAGHASQNVYLQAVSLGLGTVAVGAFEDERIKEIIGMAEDERPLYLMPVGRI